MKTETILVINLDKDTERWKNVSKECEKVGLVPIRVSGVHGSKLSSMERENNTTPWCNNFCTSSMIGCWLSHLKCWKYIVNNNIDSALVLEDDAKFTDNFREKVDEYTQNLPPDWDILLLGTVATCLGDCGLYSIVHYALRILQNIRTDTVKISDNLYKVGQFVGCHGYIINNKGAKKCVEIFGLADGHIDVKIAKNTNNLNVYAVSPSLIKQFSTSDGTTQYKSFPKTLNTIFDHGKVDGSGFGYAFTMPFFQVKNYLINLWCVFFLLYGILLGITKSKVLLSLIIVLFVIEVVLGGKGVMIQIMGSMIMILLGFSIKKVI